MEAEKIMKTVCAFETRDHFTALSAKELLESNGIQCLIPNMFHGGLQPHLSLSAVSYRVLVDPEDLEVARDLIQGFSVKMQDEHPEWSESEQLHRLVYHCPECKSTDISESPAIRGFSDLMKLIIRMSPESSKYLKLRCRSCGFSWEIMRT
ncbi:hypothetical protein L21SP2_3015 [Salinispira pacifica]|uniref:DUF2007 domain-containing protein n=2 Tax=Salinispira pacifica TaxID=1307761 RepID=V5WLC3_9SPIO|nr:hypothetical protein L21SP2_3015 [Salinispira pacifica]